MYQSFHSPRWIFDPETIIDGPQFGNIDIPNKGIGYVIVNGMVTVKDNEFLTEKSGRFISYMEK